MFMFESNIGTVEIPGNSILDGNSVRFGVEASVSKMISKKFNFESGLRFKSYEYLTSSSVTFDLLNIENLASADLEINDNNPLGNFNSKINITLTKGVCNGGQNTNSQTAELTKKNLSEYNVIGIPLGIDYLLGEKFLQIYLGGEIVPSIHVSKKLNFETRERTSRLSGELCMNETNDLINYDILANESAIEQFNLSNFNIGFNLGVGIKHRNEKTTFKIGTFYGVDFISRFTEEVYIRKDFGLSTSFYIRV